VRDVITPLSFAAARDRSPWKEHPASACSSSFFQYPPARDKQHLELKMRILWQ